MITWLFVLLPGTVKKGYIFKNMGALIVDVKKIVTIMKTSLTVIIMKCC